MKVPVMYQVNRGVNIENYIFELEKLLEFQITREKETKDYKDINKVITDNINSIKECIANSKKMLKKIEKLNFSKQDIDNYLNSLENFIEQQKLVIDMRLDIYNSYKNKIVED